MRCAECSKIRVYIGGISSAILSVLSFDPAVGLCIMIFCVFKHVSIYLINLRFSSLTIVTLHIISGDLILLKNTDLLVICVESTHHQMKVNQGEGEVEEESAIIWTHRHIMLI